VPGRDTVAMLSSELWRRRFGGDPAIVGKQVSISGSNFTVVGIVPPGFNGLRLDRSTKPEVWVPTMMYPIFEISEFDLQHLRGGEWLSATGRLKPGTTMAQADANVAQLTESLKLIWRAEKVDNGNVTGLAVAANEARFPPDRRKTVSTLFTMLMAVVGVVLLIACCNVASLMLARAVKRQKEIGVRLALGAGRARLAQQLLTEGLMLSLAGGAAGLAVAIVAARLLASFRLFGMSAAVETGAWSGLDGRVLAFTLAVSAAAGAAFGLIPLRQALRPALLRTFGMRNALLVAQVALSMILLGGAGLFLRTLHNAQAADVTRAPENVLLARIELESKKYSEARGRQFFDTLLDRVRALPGVRTAAYVMIVPFGGRRGGTNISPFPGGKPVQVDFNAVSAEYFQTVGLPVMRGRAFDARDRQGAPPVAIVNEQMARRFWPGDDPIGKRLLVNNPKRSAEIVGVVRDGRFRGYRSQVNPCFYLPLEQWYGHLINLEVRMSGDPGGLAPAVRREIQALDRDLIVPEIQTLRSFRDAGLAQERLQAALLSGLGILALLIAAIGLYGVLAFAVAQRTREIGVRMALGADASRVVREILSRAMALIAAGLALGLAALMPLAKSISALLYGVTAAEPAVYALAAGILAMVGMLAAILPARRAARVDPVVALRYE
jgi:putative ABC transport system permease protein